MSGRSTKPGLLDFGFLTALLPCTVLVVWIVAMINSKGELIQLIFPKPRGSRDGLEGYELYITCLFIAAAYTFAVVIFCIVRRKFGTLIGIALALIIIIIAWSAYLSMRLHRMSEPIRIAQVRSLRSHAPQE